MNRKLILLECSKQVLCFRQWMTSLLLLHSYERSTGECTGATMQKGSALSVLYVKATIKESGTQKELSLPTVSPTPIAFSVVARSGSVRGLCQSYGGGGSLPSRKRESSILLRDKRKYVSNQPRIRFRLMRQLNNIKTQTYTFVFIHYMSH